MKDVLKQFAIWNEVDEPQPLRIGFILEAISYRSLDRSSWAG